MGFAINPASSTPILVPDIGAGETHDPITVVFNSAGILDSPLGKVDMGPYVSTEIDSSLSVDDLKFTYSFGDSTQFSSAFAVRDLSQDGLPADVTDPNDIFIKIVGYENT
jgi:hypothetical protein